MPEKLNTTNHLAERAERLGISQEAATYLENLTDEEACTQRCEDCGAVIIVHNNALWRFKPHIIRCYDCISLAIMSGYSPFEATYVV